MPKKFYALLHNEKKIIYESWDECKSAMTGLKGYKMKSFTDRASAEAFSSYADTADTGGNLSVFDIYTESGYIIAFVDGSYDHDIRVYSFGAIIIMPDGTEHTFSGTGNNENVVSTRNIAGELMGAMYVIKWCYDNKINKIVIAHDYEGIAKWATGSWKAKSFPAVEYIKFIQKYNKYIDIKFKKIAAHTGDYYNESVDKLAKAAIGDYKKSKEL